MINKKLVAGLVTMLVVFGILSNCLTVSIATSAEGQPHIRPREASDYEYRIGRRLADAVIRDASIVVGTVRQVVGPDGNRSPDLNERALSYEKITLGVDEWLTGQPKAALPEIELKRVPLVMGIQYGSQWKGAPWERVNLKVGARLLIAFIPENRQAENFSEIDNYTLVISDPSLFPAIREALMWHQRYRQNPKEVLNASDILDSGQHSVFVGYLVAYLWRGSSFGDPDADALALGRLLANPGFPEMSSFYAAQALGRLMFSQSRPLSEATRRLLTEELVVAGVSNRPTIAKSALGLLLRLADKNQLNMGPFLTAERRRKLTQTYQTTLASGNQRHPDFESQLRATSP